jgi:hypothetical protein
VKAKGLLEALAVLLVGASGAVAQTRPLLTEEATTAASGTVVLEVGGDAVRREPGFLTGGERDRLDAPALNVVFSPADNVEIDVGWVARVMAFDDPMLGDVSDWGDVSLRAKVRVVKGGRGPTVSGRFGMTLPQTPFATGLAPNTIRMSAQLLATQRLARLTLHANAGLALQDEVFRLHEQRDFLHYGLAGECRLGQRAAVMAELAGLAGRGYPGVDAHHELRVGVRLGGGRLRWDAALRRGLAKADGTWGLTAGLTWRLAGPSS